MISGSFHQKKLTEAFCTRVAFPYKCSVSPLPKKLWVLYWVSIDSNQSSSSAREKRDFREFGRKIRTLFFDNKTSPEIRRSGHDGGNAMPWLNNTKHNTLFFLFRKIRADPDAASRCLALPPAASRPDFEGVHFFFDFEKILHFPQGFIFEL